MSSATTAGIILLVLVIETRRGALASLVKTLKQEVSGTLVIVECFTFLVVECDTARLLSIYHLPEFSWTVR